MLADKIRTRIITSLACPILVKNDSNQGFTNCPSNVGIMYSNIIYNDMCTVVVIAVEVLQWNIIDHCSYQYKSPHGSRLSVTENILQKEL